MGEICKQIGTARRDGGIVKKLNFMQKNNPSVASRQLPLHKGAFLFVQIANCYFSYKVCQEPEPSRCARAFCGYFVSKDDDSLILAFAQLLCRCIRHNAFTITKIGIETGNIQTGFWA